MLFADHKIEKFQTRAELAAGVVPSKCIVVWKINIEGDRRGETHVILDLKEFWALFHFLSLPSACSGDARISADGNSIDASLFGEYI